MANIRHNLKNLLLKGKSFVSVINSSKENILNGNLDKRGWQSVSAGGGDDFAGIFLSAAGITDPTITSAVYTLVNDLNGYGLWSKMLGIYPLVGGTASSHSWNLKDTTKLKMRWVGGMTHDSNGVTGNGTNSYGQPDITGTTGINATNYPPLTATNYGISLYQRNTSAEYIPQFGFGYANGYVMCSYAGGTQNYFIGITASPNNATNPNKTGLFHMYGGSGVGSGIVNGTKIVTGTGGQLPSTGLGTFLWFAGNNGGGYSNRNFAFFTVSEYLNDTEAANLYISIQKFQTTLNRFVGTPIYPSFDSDAQSFMTSASITDSTQQAAVNYLVTDLKSNNLWSKMKAVYPMVGGNATSHSYNLKNPSQFQITWNGGLTHSSNGVLPNGTNGFGNTNFNPVTNSLTYNNNHLSFYSRTQAASSATQYYEMGSGDTNGGTALFLRRSNDTAAYDSGTAAANRLSVSSITDARGFYIGSSINTNIGYFYKNGSQIAIKNPLTNVSMQSYNYYILALNEQNSVVYYSNKECAFSSIGEGLTTTELTNLYTIIQNYQTILNRQV